MCLAMHKHSNPRTSANQLPEVNEEPQLPLPGITSLFADSQLIRIFGFTSSALAGLVSVKSPELSDMVSNA